MSPSGVSSEILGRETLTVSDLSGSQLSKILTYLRKVAGVALPAHPFAKTVWDLVKVRHCIVHAAGNVGLMKSPSPQKVRAATQRIAGMRVQLDGAIDIDAGVCARLIERASAWEHAILDAADLAFRVEP